MLSLSLFAIKRTNFLLESDHKLLSYVISYDVLVYYPCYVQFKDGFQSDLRY